MLVFIYLCNAVFQKKDLRQLTRIHKTQPDCINCKWERRERNKNKNEDCKWGQK